ncbi:hupothetical protein [Streptococcus criceti]|nr:hupothetical protein [Streptococcus criceti]
MIDLKNYLFKSDVRAQKDEEKVFVRKTWVYLSIPYKMSKIVYNIKVLGYLKS